MRFVPITLAFVGIAALAACSSDSFDPSRDARVRFVHASPDGPALDLYVAATRRAANVNFRGATAYLEAEAGNPAIQVTRAGQQAAIASLSAQLQAGRSYTVMATGSLAAIALVPFTDDVAAPSGNGARLRVIHAAPAASALDVYVTAPGADLNAATPAIAGLAREAASAYLDRSAGSVQVRFTTAGTKTVVLDAGTVTLAAGAVRTVVALDRNGGGTPLQSGVLADRN